MSIGKILEREAMCEERLRLRQRGEKLVFTNGCFDILHPGHVRYLAEARALGDRLLVAVNADDMVRKLKGAGRPLTPIEDRLELLAALRSVDYAVAFDEDTPAAIIEAVVPDVLVKGGDWAVESIVGRETVEGTGGRVLSLPFARGYSTSLIVARIVSRLAHES